jgi:inner membrane protein
MDNLCHTLAGAALGEAGLKQRTALGMGTLLIASNLPDIDVAVFATDTLAMSFRRGWTHGVLAMAVLPALFAGTMFAWGRFARPRSRRSEDPTLQAAVDLRGLLLLAYVGSWLHVFMDWLNSYGVRLLMPFSNRWFYGDALYIIDPILYVIFAAAIILARRARNQGHATPSRPARIGLALAGGYVALMLAANLWARAEVRQGLLRARQAADTRFMVTPVLFNPIRREVIIDLGDRYEKGVLWFEPLPHFRPAGFGVDTNATDPAAIQASQTPRFQAYLRWSRFPFFVIERTLARTRVYLSDYRYSGPSARDNWSATFVDLP